MEKWEINLEIEKGTSTEYACAFIYLKVIF